MGKNFLTGLFLSLFFLHNAAYIFLVPQSQIRFLGELILMQISRYMFFFCSGICESYLDVKFTAGIWDCGRSTGRGLRYIAFIIS